MSASILGSLPPRERPKEWFPPTTDIDSTTDLHDENTTDLTPVTEDVTPAPTPRGERESPVEKPRPLERRASNHEQASAPTPEVPIAPKLEMPIATKLKVPAPNADADAPDNVATQRPAALVPGTVLNDRYLLEQVIGTGGTAIVFRARDMLSSKTTQPNSVVAIKAPRSDLGSRERARLRLKHEFDVARRLSHSNIAHVFELHDDEQRCYMSMELIEGRLLSTLVRDWTMLAPPLARKILRECARALSHAHSRGVVHGDFKPGNVFVTPQEEVRIIDFGAAALGSGDDGTRIPAGTPAYASPDVLSGQTPEQRDDVFSFACVAYELLTGQHPFERRSSLQARDEERVPQRAWTLSATQWLALLAALSWDRAQRPANVDELLNALVAEEPGVAEMPAPIHVSADAVAVAELPSELMPPQRSWGFFVFIACALAVTLIAGQRKLDSSDDASLAISTPATLPAMPPASAQSAGVAGAMTRPEQHSPTPAPPAAVEKPAPEAATPAAQAAPAVTPAARARPPAAVSEISFESRSIVTSESSVAAVFLVKRSQPLKGRVRVSWEAVSGTADAGIDFASNAAGTVEFADGQAQRAIYVPLRNDLLKEADETFTVRLHSPNQARLGQLARVEATIRDDD